MEWSVIIKCFTFSLFFTGSHQRTFRAAVYEHALILPAERTLWVNRSTALENMMKNMIIFKQQAEIAGKQNVDILVFPEDGIYGMWYTRKGLESYLEYIPDPESETWNPCDFPNRYPNTEIQRQLSCAAKAASLYLVANIGDRQPCDHSTDSKCPKDGHYQFNTNVVYNRQGELIAKYHKVNLFFERQFDIPPNGNVVTFNTTFGKFAVFTCFDILFKTPAIDSIMQPDVGNVVFPTAWMDALPLLAAVQFHSAFAAGLKINFLSANLNLPSFRFHGSGIYTPNGYAAFWYNETRGGKLLVADLPVITSNTLNKEKTKRSQVLLQGSQPKDQFQSYVFFDLYSFVLIINKTGKIEICNNELCCYLEYEQTADTSELFAFGAFDGLHTYEGSYYLQVCTLLKCETTDRNTCGNATKESMTTFKNIKMTGTFKTQYVFPEVLLSKDGALKLSSSEHWSYDNVTLTSMMGFEHPVLSVGLFSRDYSRDSSNLYSPNMILLFAMLTLYLVQDKTYS